MYDDRSKKIHYVPTSVSTLRNKKLTNNCTKLQTIKTIWKFEFSVNQSCLLNVTKKINYIRNFSLRNKNKYFFHLQTPIWKVPIINFSTFWTLISNLTTNKKIFVKETHYDETIKANKVKFCRKRKYRSSLSIFGPVLLSLGNLKRAPLRGVDHLVSREKGTICLACPCKLGVSIDHKALTRMQTYVLGTRKYGNSSQYYDVFRGPEYVTLLSANPLTRHVDQHATEEKKVTDFSNNSRNFSKWNVKQKNLLKNIN